MLDSILNKIFSHATIILEKDSFNLDSDYNKLKLELSKAGINYICFDTNPKATDSDSRSLNFKIDDLQKIRDFQNSKSSERRFIITDRSLRNTVIQNALLKIIEEPTENTFIIIFTKDVSMLLPTILSRCQLMKDLEKSSGKNNINNSDKNTIKEEAPNQKTKEKIINSKSINTANSEGNKYENRFEKLERFLIIENLNERGLVSQKQFEEYKNLV